MPRKVSRPIQVHSVGFPAWAADDEIRTWLIDHDLPEPVAILRGGAKARYVWARMQNVSDLHGYRTSTWQTSTWGPVQVRYAIHKRRLAERQEAPLRRVAAR